MTQSNQFWKTKKLNELNDQEWESLCDGCGKCCLNKLIDDSTTPAAVAFTWVSCKYLDLNSCKCKDYQNRLQNVSNCLKISSKNLAEISSHLPQTCSYRLLYEGSDLPSWHPLVCMDPNLIHLLEVSIKDKAINEEDIDPDDIESFIIEEEDF